MPSSETAHPDEPTGITPPGAVHAGVAAGAADAVDLLVSHPDLPAIGGIDVDYSHVEQRPCVHCRLSGNSDRRAPSLADVVTWADELDTDTVTVCRIEHPEPFTSVTLHADIGGSQVRIWAHPEPGELEALWSEVGRTVEPGIAVTLSLRALRAAAEPDELDPFDIGLEDEDEGVSA